MQSLRPLYKTVGPLFLRNFFNGFIEHIHRRFKARKTCASKFGDKKKSYNARSGLGYGGCFISFSFEAFKYASIILADYEDAFLSLSSVDVPIFSSLIFKQFCSVLIFRKKKPSFFTNASTFLNFRRKIFKRKDTLCQLDFS